VWRGECEGLVRSDLLSKASCFLTDRSWGTASMDSGPCACARVRVYFGCHALARLGWRWPGLPAVWRGWCGHPKLWFVVVGKILVEKSVTGRSGGAPLAWIRRVFMRVFWLLCVRRSLPGRVSRRCARFGGGGAAVWGGGWGQPL
jgi:hypothetical protein